MGKHFFASFLDRSAVSIPITCRTSCGFWQWQTQTLPSRFLSLSLPLWRTGLSLKAMDISLGASSIMHQPVKQDRHTLPQSRDAPADLLPMGLSLVGSEAALFHAPMGQHLPTTGQRGNLLQWERRQSSPQRGCLIKSVFLLASWFVSKASN